MVKSSVVGSPGVQAPEGDSNKGNVVSEKVIVAVLKKKKENV